jgi:transcription elongation factor GreA
VAENGQADIKADDAMAKNLLTRAGYEKLLQELELLHNVERPRVVHEILESAAAGPQEKNLDFQRLLSRRQWLEGRIQQLQEILSNSEVLVGSNLPPDQVRFNCQVRLVNLHTGKEHRLKLVGEVEADAFNGSLSIASPLGRALLGKASGDKVEVDTPAGRRAYQILEIVMDEW